MSRLSLYLLGTPRVEHDGEPIHVDTRKAIALLAYLAVTRERHRRDALVNLLWPESDQSHGRAALRRTLSVLRKAVAGDWLESDRENIALNPDAGFWLDVDQFHLHLAECHTHRHPASEVCPACLVSLRAATALHRGDFMSGFGLRDSFNFDDWQFFQAETLRRERIDALQRLVQCLCADRDLETAIGYARQWIEIDRLDENAHSQLMLLYAWSGRRAGALRQYQECARILESNLGVSPQTSIVDLYRAIVEGHAPPPPSRPLKPRAVVEELAALEPTTDPEQAAPKRTGLVPAEGEKHIVTVLVADASRSFAKMTNVGAEDETGLMRALIQIVEDEVNAHGGRVAHVLGQSVLAAFGAQRTHESDPELAIRSALRIRQAARKLGLDTAAGIHTGEIFIERKEGEGQPSLQITGSIANQAASLARQAQAGQILVGRPTFRLTHRAFDFVPLSLDFDKAGAQVIAYRLEHLLATPRKARGVEGLQSALIGRDRELARLQEVFAQVLDGQGQMVSLIGEAGVGKSRLVAELRERALAPRVDGTMPLWLEGRCLELGTPTGYAPLIDMLREYLAWRPGGEERQRRERIVYSLQRLVEQGHLAGERVAEMGPLLGRLLSVPWNAAWEARVAEESPDQVRHRTFLALHDFVLALSRQRPVVLVFEDLHWADTLSLDLISLLMEALSQGPLLLLCAYRPEREHRCWHLATVAAQKCGGRYTEFALRELSHSHSRQMVESLLASTSLAPSILDRAWSQSQGNPFFIEEVIRSLVDEGVVYREGQDWHARPGHDGVTVSEGVQSVILSRVDRLDERSRHVLQIAAVIGRVFRQQVLARILPDEVDLAGVLWELEERALIYQERAIPEVEYSFKHVLTREAVYHNLPRRRRQALHRQAASAIEELYTENVIEYAEQLAHHCDRGGDVEKAVTYLRQAGEKARRSDANEEAITHLDRGLELLRTLPESLERDGNELDMLVAMGVSLVLTQGHAASKVQRTYARALELSERLDDRAQRFHVLLGLRRFHLHRGNVATAHDLGEQLLALAKHTDDPLQLSRAHMMHAETLYCLGAFVQACEHSEKGLTCYAPQQGPSHILLYGNDTGIGCRILHAQALWHLGFPDQAAREGQELLALAHKLAHPFTLVYALHFTALVCQLCRQVQMAQRQEEAVIRISQEHGFALYRALATILHGWTLVWQGSEARGIEQIQAGIADRRETGGTTFLPCSLALLAEACGLAGRTQEALNQINTALELVRESQECFWEAELYRLKGELLLQIGEEETLAETCFERALAVARHQRAKSWELRAATSRARLWQQQGRAADAGTLLGEVYNWFSEGFDTADLIEARELLEALGRTESIG